jgi:drug/metabolite transporter (DMT)-like permease
LPWLLAMWALARLAGLAGPPVWAPSGVALAQLVTAGVFCTALATVAWNTGVNRLGIQTGGMWQNTVPVFAVVIGLLFFGVQPLAEQIVGGAIVLVGVLYMQWQRSQVRQKSPVPSVDPKD